MTSRTQVQSDSRGIDARQPTSIDLFAGAGGLTVGLEQAGFRTLVATDVDPDCVATLTQNQARRISVGGSGSRYLEGTQIIQADIAELGVRNLGVKPADVDLVTGGPPCQPFSSAGSQLGLGDSRGLLFREFARLVSEIRPRMFLFENVRGLVTARGPSGRPGEALELVRSAFEQAGYATRCALLNAADFGAAQRRVRLFIIGSRISVLPDFPRPTHSADPCPLFSEAHRWTTLGEFLSDFGPPDDAHVTRPSPKLLAQLRRLKPGSGLKSPGVRETTRPGGHWGYKQGTFIADPSKPARTITAASTQDWIRLADGGLRRLTLDECAALQGFPREWRFVGSRTSQFRQIGNAVPAVFGSVIGPRLINAIRGYQAGEFSRRRAMSASLPPSFHRYIEYTARDEARNGIDRPRSQRRVAEIEE